MAFQVSPGVNVTEIDATTIVPSVATSNAAIACAFKWGPVDVITTISSENDLAKVFGIPDNDTATNWLTASSFLAYSGGLQVVRTIDSTHRNSTDGATDTVTTSIEDVGNGFSEDDDVHGTVAGGDEGTLQLVGDTYGSGTHTGEGLEVNYTATAEGGLNTVTALTVPTSTAAYATNASGYYTTVTAGDANGVVKIVVTNNGAATTDFVFTVINAGTGYVVTGENGIDVLELGAPGKIITMIDEVTATEVGGNNQLEDVTVTVAGGSTLEAGDRIAWIRSGDDGTAIIKLTGFASNTVVRNREDFDNQSLSGVCSFVSRYPGLQGNGIDVLIHHYNDGVLETDAEAGTGYSFTWGDFFDVAPNTSDYVKARNGNASIRDEIHVAVVDQTGEITGTAGYLLEKYAFVSLCTDARSDTGDTNYFKEVINNNSQYIWATGDWTAANATNASDWETSPVSSRSDAFGDSDTIIRQLAGGAGDNAAANKLADRTATGKGYDLFADDEITDVGILIAGQDVESDVEGQLIKNLIDNVVSKRNDCILFYSPRKSDVVASQDSSTLTGRVTSYSNTVNRPTSYAVMDSGWKKIYDRHNDVYRDIPLNGDIAGLVAQTEQTNDAWWSPAGYNRGNIKNVVKLHLNPTKANRDALYKAGINPVVSFPGQGTVLFGDKTTLSRPSAFDRINVRRLFIVLEKAISSAAKFSLFEFNDAFTRSQFRSLVEPFLRNIKAKRGIYDYQVVCDATNNTSDVVDRNEFVGDIYIKPARSINFIQLNFIAVRTGVSFSEVAGSA